MWGGLFWLSVHKKREGLHREHYERIMWGEVSSAGTPTGQARVWTQSPQCTWLTSPEYWMKPGYIHHDSLKVLPKNQLNVKINKGIKCLFCLPKAQINIYTNVKRVRAASPHFDLTRPVRIRAHSPQSWNQFLCAWSFFVISIWHFGCFIWGRDDRLFDRGNSKMWGFKSYLNTMMFCWCFGFCSGLRAFLGGNLCSVDVLLMYFHSIIIWEPSHFVFIFINNVHFSWVS